MQSIKLGHKIRIKRSDGSLDIAKISEINSAKKTFLVECIDHNVKLKHVNMRDVLKLNPSLGSVEAATCAVARHTADGQTKRESALTTRLANKSPKTLIPPVRRSEGVVEMERLNKQRDQKLKERQRQAESMEEKKALMAADPGNPNWEVDAMIRKYRETLKFRPLTAGQAQVDHRIMVCVRKRPLNNKEVQCKEPDAVSVPSKDIIIVHEPRCKVDLTKFLENHKFRFDFVFDENCNNRMVYEYTAKPLVRTIFEGGNATCFAYGQTGSGKTYTMGGEFLGKTQNGKNGIYGMVAEDIFHTAQTKRYRPLQFVVSTSFFEIYGSKVFDLLCHKKKLNILEDGNRQVQIKGLIEKTVSSVDDVLKLITSGNSERSFARTSSNENSSRSHVILQIILRSKGCQKTHGKFSIVDLAGNERGCDNINDTRETRSERSNINKSLLVLKECIRALGKASAHLPFRGCQLTKVLRDSFIGDNNRTCMIATIAPGLNACDPTLDTLRYADRVKELVINEIPEPNNENNDEANAAAVSKDSDVAGNFENQAIQNDSSHENNNNKIYDTSSLHYSISMKIQLLRRAAAMTIENHRIINRFLRKFIKKSVELFEHTKDPNFNGDYYSMKSEDLFEHLAFVATSGHTAIKEFREEAKRVWDMIEHNEQEQNERE